MPCSTFLNCWALVLITVGTGEEVRLKRLVDQSAPLSVGATEGEVLAHLGEPDWRWGARRGLLFGRPAQWIYGTTIDLQTIILPEFPFLNPIPINIRLFGADEDDLVIEWTAEKRVSAVKRPEIDVPDELTKAYEPFFVVGDLVRALASKRRD